MSSERRTVTTFAALLDSGILAVSDGYRAKNEELGGSGPIFLRAGCVTDFGFDLNGAERFKLPMARGTESKLSRHGDVLVTTKGNSTGRVAFVGPGFPSVVYSPHLSYWRSLKPEQLAPGFLRYWSRSREFRTQLDALKPSTDMAPYLSLIDQRRLLISLPTIEEQRRISEMLSALDDKIDLNRRTNETLEGIARALFKSWFVDFDPVREKDHRSAGGGARALFPTRLMDSELGSIPSGWSVVPYSRTVEILGGGTPKTSVKEYWGGTIPWFSVVDSPRDADVWVVQTEKSITEAGLENSAARILPQGTTIITARGTVGRVALVAEPMAMNQSCYGLVGRDGSGTFLTYFRTRFAVATLQSHAHGSVFDTITRDTFVPLSVVQPTPEVAAAFEAHVQPYLRRVEQALREVVTLGALRNLLLPKLISGEIRLRDAERGVAAAV